MIARSMIKGVYVNIPHLYSTAPGVINLTTGIVNMDTTILSLDRTAPDAISYNVMSLTANSATLSTAPKSNELAAGDQVALMNVVGIPSAYGNTGNYEYLTVQSLAGTVVNFTSNKLNSYGNSTDNNLGVTRNTNQQVILQRVPQWISLTIASGATLTCNPVSATGIGGRIIFNAATLLNNGIIDVSAKGLPLWCGIGGGSGGYGAGKQGGNSGGGAGHLTNGQAGRDTTANQYGQGGGAYGVADLSKIYMGSGGGCLLR